QPYVRFWMHNNMVTINGIKMGKSLKNSINLKEMFKETDPLVIRFFILQSHYRSQLDYSETAIKASKTGLEKLCETQRRLREQKSGSGVFDITPFHRRFTEAMDDDFNTPVAISILFELSKAINAALDGTEAISEASRQDIEAFLDKAGRNTLCILKLDDLSDNRESVKKFDDVMTILLEIRAEARKNKDFALGDKIRDRLIEAGIEIKDTREGASWSVQS
ncbi:MAG: DALR domain-containing protein, partial [Chlorobiaceae bacterium]